MEMIYLSDTLSIILNIPGITVIIFIKQDNIEKKDCIYVTVSFLDSA